MAPCDIEVTTRDNQGKLTMMKCLVSGGKWQQLHLSPVAGKLQHTNKQPESQCATRGERGEEREREREGVRERGG